MIRLFDRIRRSCSQPGLPLHCLVSVLRISAIMATIVNLEETPGKTVGKIPRRSPAQFLERMAAQFHAMGLKLPYPKGVYRFKTFEEADAWEMKHRIAAAVKRLRDHQR